MEKREQKVCQNCKKSFTIEPADFKFYEKMDVPAPTFCPECRLVRRLSFRNERNLYPGTCHMCKKPVISMYSGDKPYKVYCQPDWWSDKWDGLEYAREYDFSRPFFDQFNELMHEVPWTSLMTTYTTLVNSDYVNLAGYVKNCYLISHADHNEDCYYGSAIKYSRDCVDITMMQQAEFCYDSLNIMQGYQNFYSADCENCNDVYFSKNLVGCSNCFGCVNLRHKSYYIFNKLFSKQNYEKKIKEFNLGSYKEVQEFKKKAHSFWKQFPSKYYHGSKNQNVSGDYIYNCKNVEYSYEMIGAEDCKYSQNLSTKPSKDCYDYLEWGQGANFIYEAGQSGEGINNVKFVYIVYTSRNAQYSMALSGCQNIFGSIALRHKKYCILNKQYSKSNYNFGIVFSLGSLCLNNFL